MQGDTYCVVVEDERHFELVVACIQKVSTRGHPLAAQTEAKPVPSRLDTHQRIAVMGFNVDKSRGHCRIDIYEPDCSVGCSSIVDGQVAWPRAPGGFDCRARRKPLNGLIARTRRHFWNDSFNCRREWTVAAVGT